jgi:hypothetical protein
LVSQAVAASISKSGIPMDSLDKLPAGARNALPDFSANGAAPNSLPPGHYFPSKSDFEERFVAGSRRRTIIYDGWNEHRNALLEAGLPAIARELLNGSFTTSKNEPGDIDLAVEVPDAHAVLTDTQRWKPIVALLQGPEMKKDYECDAYPIFILPADHADYASVTLEGIRYWTKWFGRTRNGACKGRVWTTV